MVLVKTSQAALDFARTCCSVHVPLEKPSKAKGQHFPPEQTQQVKKPGIDYSKWDDFLAEVEQQEGRPTHQNAMQQAHAALGGCAHDRSQERQIYEKPTEEKLKAAERFCEIGNAHVAHEEYEQAAVAYRKGEIQLDYTFPDRPEDEERMRTVKLRIHLNASLCALRLRDWDRCSSECYQALQIDPENAKALYRKGQMFLQQDLFSNAREEFQKALATAPGDVGILAAQRELQQREREYRARAKVVARKAFSSN